MFLITLMLAIEQQSSVDIRTLRSRQHGLGVVEEDTHFVVVVVNDDDIDSGGGDGRKYSGYWDTLVWGQGGGYGLDEGNEHCDSSQLSY